MQQLTTICTGSHKANFPMNPRFLRELEPQTDAIDDADRSELIAGYSCPAGSVVIFTESLIHAANDWTNPRNRRCAVFNCCASTSAPSTSQLQPFF